MVVASPNSFPPPSRPREPRYAYGGTVRLLAALPPWRLLISLTGRNLSTTGLQTVLPAATLARTPDLERFLAEGQYFDLQLEHDIEHLPAILVRARLQRRRRIQASVLGDGGLELAFLFIGQGSTPRGGADVGLLSLVHELCLQSQVYPSRPEAHGATR